MTQPGTRARLKHIRLLQSEYPSLALREAESLLADLLKEDRQSGSDGHLDESIKLLTLIIFDLCRQESAQWASDKAYGIIQRASGEGTGVPGDSMEDRVKTW